MLWKILFGAVAALFGYWAWIDRRFYAHGVLGSALWALGVSAGTYTVLWLVALIFSLFTK